MGGDNRRIIRVGHNQATDHPTNIALMAFEEYIESKLGDKYNVEVYPSELLGSQTDMVQLTQTGAIDFCVASNSILEPFQRTIPCLICPICSRRQRPTTLPWTTRKWWIPF